MCVTLICACILSGSKCVFQCRCSEAVVSGQAAAIWSAVFCGTLFDMVDRLVFAGGNESND